jgi:hypothetical protein
MLDVCEALKDEWDIIKYHCKNITKSHSGPLR